jgi:FkbM family methyltransferase
MLKDFKFIFQKIFIPDHLILKKRILRSIKSKIEQEYLVLPQLCNKNHISVDIGMFRGVYSFLLSKYSKSVIGYEANPIMYKYLEKNLKKIVKKIEIYNVALSNRTGNAYIKIPFRNKSILKSNFEDYYEGGLATIHPDNELEQKSFEKFTTKCNILDNFKFNEKIGFIKIDVEGHEQFILEGAINTLNKDKPNLLIEIEKKHRLDSVKTTFNYLKNLGYEAYTFRDNKLNLLTDLNDQKSVNYIFKANC